MDITNDKPNYLIAYALNLWANYIETGDPNLSALDTERVGKPVRALSTYQMASVIRLRQMATVQYNRV